VSSAGSEDLGVPTGEVSADVPELGGGEFPHLLLHAGGPAPLQTGALQSPGSRQIQACTRARLHWESGDYFTIRKDILN